MDKTLSRSLTGCNLRDGNFWRSHKKFVDSSQPGRNRQVAEERRSKSDRKGSNFPDAVSATVTSRVGPANKSKNTNTQVEGEHFRLPPHSFADSQKVTEHVSFSEDHPKTRGPPPGCRDDDVAGDNQSQLSVYV